MCSRTMLSCGAGGNQFLSSEGIGLLCDGVHNEAHMLNCKDLTFLKGMKGSESFPGM